MPYNEEYFIFGGEILHTTMKYLILTCLLNIFVFQSHAQSDEVPKGQFWLGLQFAVPVGEFADQIERDFGYGGNFGGLWNPSKKNNFFQVGADIGINYMGKDKKDIDNIPMKTTSTLFTTHLVVRLTVQSDAPIKPYIDLLGGGKFFSLTTKYDNDLLATALDIEDKSIFGEQSFGVWSYGIGGGISMRRQNVGLDIRVLYLPSGEIDYISPENFKQDDQGNYYYESKPIKKTNMVFPQIGFSVDF